MHDEPSHPRHRPRRLRRTPGLRAMVRETRLARDQLIQPVFVVERDDQAGPIAAMPGVSRLTLAELDREIDAIGEAGVGAVLVFGVPAAKDASASGAVGARGVVPRAVERIRARAARMTIITDVCLCSYTDHGHCGVLQGDRVDNDATLGVIARSAVAHAAAGADLVAPSGMMDGMVGAIRAALDDAAHIDTGILSYAVKYASSFYGPFREAADSAPQFGDRRSYQMDSANVREALAEAKLDLAEGADMLMVKPALPYLDVLRYLRDELPDARFAAYQVSGEYAMIAAAAQRGWLDERAVVLESLTAIRRAGADAIITYFAKQAAVWIGG
jgi:porphobilinogen synthase